MFQFIVSTDGLLGCLRSLPLALAGFLSPWPSLIFHLTHGLSLLVHLGTPWVWPQGLELTAGGSEQPWGPALDLRSARTAEFTLTWPLWGWCSGRCLLGALFLASHLSLPVLTVPWTYLALGAQGQESCVPSYVFSSHIALSHWWVFCSATLHSPPLLEQLTLSGDGVLSLQQGRKLALSCPEGSPRWFMEC